MREDTPPTWQFGEAVLVMFISGILAIFIFALGFGYRLAVLPFTRRWRAWRYDRRCRMGRRLRRQLREALQ